MNAAPLLTLEQLNAEQQEAVRLVRSGENILVSGPGGTGKSVILRYLSETLDQFHITSSTGISALNVGGCTIHSWASLGVGEDSAKVIAERLLEKCNAVWYSICKAKTIAIDEVSMISEELFDKLDEVLRIVRKSSRPFGGIQVLAFGDFLQLPPVSKTGDAAAKFAFESKAWKAGKFKVVVLRRVMRQANEAFASILSRVREGDTSEEVRAYLRPRINAVDPDPTIKPVVLMTHNADADAENIQSLMRLDPPEYSFEADDWAVSEYQRKAIDRDCIAPKTLLLRKGAQVMLLWNMLDVGLANGSIGIVEDVIDREQKIPVVRFANGELHEIEPRQWKTVRHRETVASRTQIPLRLAYAITIHKAQGMTLDKVEVSLKRCFSPGQAYVALSRARTIEGLFIRDISGNSISAHPDALNFYRNHAVK